MAFKIGDKVRVNTRRHGFDQYGAEGVIEKVRDSHDWSLPYIVRFTGGTPQDRTTNSYSEGDLTLITSSEFAVGDRVVCIVEPSDNDGDALLNKVGTIVLIDEDDDELTYDVKWDDWSGEFGGTKWWVNKSHITKTTNPVFIVIKADKSGRLFAATSPYQHITREAAEKEAVRLASQNFGYNFVVFQVVTSVENPEIPAPVLKKVA